MVLEREVLRAASRGVRSVVLRPPLVYGRGGSIQVPLLIRIARSTAAARYVGAGENVWSTVHIGDLADLYVLAAEHASAGDLFHAASGEETMHDLAGAVGRLLGLGTPVSWSLEEVRAWGGFAAGLGSNSRISADKTRATLGWIHRKTLRSDGHRARLLPGPATEEGNVMSPIVDALDGLEPVVEGGRAVLEQLQIVTGALSRVARASAPD